MVIPVGMLSAKAQALLSADLRDGIPEPVSVDDARRVMQFMKVLETHITASRQGTHCRIHVIVIFLTRWP
jgi:hypothetical protein